MIPVLGAGLAGLSAAYHLGVEHLILEKEANIGGLCKSIHIDGYVFDHAPHILFTRNEYVNSLFYKLLKGNLITQERRAYIYIKETYVKYPFEVNLHNLPEKIRKECIEGLRNRLHVEPRNFEEWIFATFGEGIAHYYMVPYNRKLWKHNLAGMGFEWINGRVPSPNVEEIEKGALGELKKDFGPNAMFMYPIKGGIGALANQLSKGLNIFTKTKVTGIKTKGKKLKIQMQKGEKRKEITSKHVLSSIPLPDLVGMLDEAPTEVIKAADSLQYNSLVCVSIGVKRPKINDKHWIYFPENHFIFNRISFPMNFSHYTAPKGRSTILVEVTHKGEIMNKENIIDQVFDDLIKAEILRENEKVEICNASRFKYAYVIYDLHHRRNVETIHNYLKDKKIIPIGRFGEWEYYNMDKSIISGKQSAETVNKGSI